MNAGKDGMGRTQKPLLTEAVMFFAEHGISREMLFPEFEALLDGLVAAPACADESIEAVFLQINNRLHIRAAVFFTIDFDMDGCVNRLWNMPLRQLAEKAGRGPDMGGGPIRLVCLGFAADRNFRANLWRPRQRGGRADLSLLKLAVSRNTLGILGNDEEAVALDNLPVLAEEQADIGSAVLQAEQKNIHAGEVADYLRQFGALQARLDKQEQQHQQQLQQLRAQHAEQLAVAQGELLDIKKELAYQQKLNTLLRRELTKLQSRAPSGAG